MGASVRSQLLAMGVIVALVLLVYGVTGIKISISASTNLVTFVVAFVAYHFLSHGFDALFLRQEIAQKLEEREKVTEPEQVKPTDEFIASARNKDLILCNQVLEQGLDPNALVSSSASRTDYMSGARLLHWAVKIGPDLVELLIRHGANIEIADTNGETPLHWAARRGRVDIAELLLEHGARIDSQTKEGRQPLHLAVIGQHADVVSLLISRGANVRAQDSDGYAPYRFAQVLKSKQVRKIIDDVMGEQAKRIKEMREEKGDPTRILFIAIAVLFVLTIITGIIFKLIR